MNKELFLEIVDWLTEYKSNIDELEEVFMLFDAFKLPFIQWDNALKYVCAAAGFDDIIKYGISDLVWNGSAGVPTDPNDPHSEAIAVDASTFYDIMIGEPGVEE